MKTATDVIERLQREAGVDQEDIAVGYIDRLVGLQERPLTVLILENSASGPLAIPHYKIQYFKYKGVKVWDKNEGLDNVFGSTGSGCTITKAIARYEATLRQQTYGAVGDGASAGDHAGDCEEVYLRSPGVTEQADTDLEKSNEAGGTCTDVKYYKTTNYTPVSSTSKQQYTTKRGGRPNYFFGVKLQNEGTAEALEAVQNKVGDLYPGYREYAINKNGFHLTLCVLSLRSPAEIRTCTKAMTEMSNEVRKYMQRIEPLAFEDLGNFGTNVVFAKVIYTSAFLDLVNFICEKLFEAGINLIISHDFNPHITLFKVPRFGWSAGRRDPPNLSPFDDMEFGRQAVDNIHLCKMGTLTKTSDFYKIEKSILL